MGEISARTSFWSGIVHEMKKINLAIVIPVFNDWESVSLLLPMIDNALNHTEVTARVVVINDGSNEEAYIDVSSLTELSLVHDIEIIHLNCNLGHQRAIAIGLTHVASLLSIDAVVVMDSDGEDRPEDIANLLHHHLNNKDNIIVANRKERSEGMMFQIAYYVYRMIFRVLTGRHISFGNFCLIPFAALKRLIYLDSLWNHLPATILRSKIQLSKVPTKRGKRLKSKAKMNFGDLVLHGLSAVSVYIDIMLLRTLALSIVFGAVTFFGIIAVAVVRLFTNLAIPGWASNVVGSLSIILLLSLILSIFVLFIILANRSLLTIIPAIHVSDYIKNVQNVFQK